MHVNNSPIKVVEEFKYLGLILDPTFSFKKHIKKVSNTVKYSLSIFRHIRDTLTQDAAKIYLDAMIFSHINYCISSWSQTSITTLKPLQSLYNQAVKVLDKKPLRYHHCHIFEKYKMLNFDNLIEYSNVRLIFKIVNNSAPPPLKKFVHLCSETTTRTSRSTSHNDCRLPSRDSQFARSAFSYKGIEQWNKLPGMLKLSKDLKIFSCSIRDMLIENQRCCH